MTVGVLRIYCDGGSRGNPGPGAAAFVVVDKNGKIVGKQGIFLGHTTNNQAEYQAVLLAFSFLEKATLQAANTITFFLDSELVTRQLVGHYKIRDKKLKLLAMAIKRQEQRLKAPIKYQSIPRSHNILADFLVNKILDKYTNSRS